MSQSSLAALIVNVHLAGGVLCNSLLLYAIRRYSGSSLGTYKYLLGSFATFDICLSIVHAVTRPSVVIMDRMYGVVTYTHLEDRSITACYTACVTVPFCLMIIHFLFRFWSVRFPHLIALFSKKRFIAFLVMATAGEFMIWYLLCTRIMGGDVGEASTIRISEEFERRYGIVIRDGWQLVNFAEEDGLRTRSIMAMFGFDVIMVGSFATGITLALLTVHFLSSISNNFSVSSIVLQRRLLFALCAQTFVPLVFVYIPFMGVNHAAFLNLPIFSIDRACMHLTACFPAWDAILIIGVIRDFRHGLLSLIVPKKKPSKSAPGPMTYMTAEASTVAITVI